MTTLVVPVFALSLFEVSLPVRDVLLLRSYFIGMAVLASMIYLRYRVARYFKTPVWYGFGLIAGIFFLLGTAVAIYRYPLSGVIVSVGLSAVIFALGVALGRIVWGPDDLVSTDMGEDP